MNHTENQNKVTITVDSSTRSIAYVASMDFQVPLDLEGDQLKEWSQELIIEVQAAADQLITDVQNAHFGSAQGVQGTVLIDSGVVSTARLAEGVAALAVSSAADKISHHRFNVRMSQLNLQQLDESFTMSYSIQRFDPVNGYTSFSIIPHGFVSAFGVFPSGEMSFTLRYVADMRVTKEHIEESSEFHKTTLLESIDDLLDYSGNFGETMVGVADRMRLQASESTQGATPNLPQPKLKLPEGSVWRSTLADVLERTFERTTARAVESDTIQRTILFFDSVFTMKPVEGLVELRHELRERLVTTSTPELLPTSDAYRETQGDEEVIWATTTATSSEPQPKDETPV